MKSLLFVWYWLIAPLSLAQLPVEMVVGTQRTSLDILFFKSFKNSQGEVSPWLFFNRNRAVYDPTSKQSSFGFTEAISYQPTRWKGFAPVGVVQWVSTGLFPKVGLQKVVARENILGFSWMVLETKRDPRLDYFLLIRWTPVLKGQIKVFSQVEWIHSFATRRIGQPTQSTQRGRLGLKYTAVQAGFGFDRSRVSGSDGIIFQNWGGFLRYEF